MDGQLDLANQQACPKLAPPQQQGPNAGLMEVREFMARFVDQVPDLDDLEAAVADPAQNQQHMQVSPIHFSSAWVLCDLAGVGILLPHTD